jgi:hypothetical protein
MQQNLESHRAKLYAWWLQTPCLEFDDNDRQQKIVDERKTNLEWSCLESRNSVVTSCCDLTFLRDQEAC